MDSSKNYYAVLSILPTAEVVVIKAAYRALAQRYHPDRWVGPKSEADARMKEINEAYEVLSNENRRREYDRARKNRSMRDDDLENDFAQSAFRDAEQAQSSDWEIALDYYPDIEMIYSELKRTSIKLAFAFRATLLETKRFEDRARLAAALESEFLQTYFGTNPVILAFARTLIEGGHKNAAKELNRAISVLGEKADHSVVIPRIRAKFFPERPPETSTRSVRELAQTLLMTQFVADAQNLIDKLGGTIKYVPVGFFGRSEMLLSVLNISRTFKTEYDMVQWIIKNVVPKIS